MKCYYRIGDGEWIKGFVQSLSGATEVNFHSRSESGTVENQITLGSRPEVLFCGSYMIVTGLVSQKDGLYKLVSVDVSGGWVKPNVR